MREREVRQWQGFQPEQKEALSKTAGAVERSNFGLEIDMGPAESKSQVFEGQVKFKQ